MFRPRLDLPLIVLTVAATGCMQDRVRRDPAAVAEAKAVKFLAREVPAWSRDNGCFSCHNNGDAARALYAASRHGYHIPAHVLADTTAWVSKPHRWDHNKGDPGFSDKHLANIQFAAALVAASEAGYVKERRSLEEAARKVTADQGADGGWAIEPGNAIGSPATYGTALATWMALTILEQTAASGTSVAIQMAKESLRHAKPNNVPTAATLLLASTHARVAGRSMPLTRRAGTLSPSEGERNGVRGQSREFKGATRIETSGSSLRGEKPALATGIFTNSIFKAEESLKLIRRAQTRDGGWGSYLDSTPEPFDTAIVLLALEEIRHTPGIDDMIQRGRAFLAAEQNPDGSWPATTRPPGGDSYAQRISTTGWATLALLATRE